MSDTFVTVRTFDFPNGSKVSVPMRSCETREDAQRVSREEAQSLELLMSAQLVIPVAGGQVRPLGMTLREALKHLGITGVGHGAQTVERESPILSPKLILGSH